MNSALATGVRGAEGGGVLRLDLPVNRRGPLLSVNEAVAAGGANLRPAALAARLRQSLASRTGLPADWFLFADRPEHLVSALMLSTNRSDELVRFDPGDHGIARSAHRLGRSALVLPRDPRHVVVADPDILEALPPSATVVVGSPSDPSGAVLPGQALVRLARAFATVVVDEQHGGYGGRSLLPYVRELDNVVVVQSLQNWAALDAFPLAYAVARPSLLERVANALPGEVTSGGLAAAVATLEDPIGCQMLIRRAREDRSRLFRTLRKLSLVQPMPTMSNFLLARVELSSRGVVARELHARGIAVHLPEGPAFHRHVRITAGTAEESDALKRALIEVTRAVV